MVPNTDLTHCTLKTPKLVILAKSAEPDQTPQHDASDQGLHCSQIVHHFSLRIFKSFRLTYAKSKLESSNI